VILRFWTTCTLSATVAAVGLTSTGVASAAAAMPAMLDGMPADIATQAPLHTCPALQDIGHGMEKAPCLDTDLGVSVPNPARKADLGGTVDGALDAAQNTNGGLPRMIGRVVPTANDLVKNRPTVDLGVRPSYPGVLEPRSRAGVLDTRIGPHQRNQNGVSALDTAAEVDAIQGYNLQPGAAPTAMVRSLTAPATDTGGPAQPTDATPGEELQNGLGTIVDALGTTLHSARSAS
jgi:hypothetical protein